MRCGAALLAGMLIGLFIGAYFHDRDMVRNYTECGDAKAWAGKIIK